MGRFRRWHTVVVVVALVAAGCAPRKKLIEFGWDEPDAAFMRAHVEEMERTPFDGCVYHVSYARPGGQGSFTWEAWGRRAFTPAELDAARRDLRATRFRRFRYNFLRLNVTPGDLDWFDDYDAVRANARLAASLAREGRSRGVLLDTETYNAPLFWYAKQSGAGTRLWPEYVGQARKRGHEVMEALQEGYPGLTVFLTFGYSLPWMQAKAGKKPLSACQYGLLAPFLDGMVWAARGRTRIVDGYELSYGYRDPGLFPAARRTMKEELLPIVADRAAYTRVVSAGFGLWVDYNWRAYGWRTDKPDANYFTPAVFEQSVRAAISDADEYVWIYSETPRWWTASGGAKDLPADYVAALRRARRPARQR
ncbi:MAG TPA: hypothetical protein VGL15_08425 [Vicinamibacteria bacterium]